MHVEANCIVAQMQAIAPEELGLQTITTTAEIPAWIPESELERFTRASSWHEGIRLYCTDVWAPSGRVSDLRTSARQIGEHTLRLPTQILNNGLPRITLTTDEQQLQHRMSMYAQPMAEYKGRVLAEALWRIQSRYGTPERDELTTLLLELGAQDARLARGVAKGFEYFWAGDCEAAVGVVIPKIEAAARALLRQLGEGIYRVQTKKAGGYVGLHFLLEGLEKLALDE